MTELVSVCMPARNAAAWIEEAAESILCQSYDNLELIVVDDHSDDTTLDILSALSERDDRLRFFASSQCGVVAARTEAYLRAKGELVANMDADDIALPKRIEAQVSAMATGLDLCGTQFDYLFGTERRTPRTRLPLTQIDAACQLFWSNPVSNPSVMFRLSTFAPSGLPYIAGYVPSADYQLWTRLLLNPEIRFANLPDVHMLYRAHAEQLTRPGGFTNRVAATRVRLELLQTSGIDLDPRTLRAFCVAHDAALRRVAASDSNTGTDHRDVIQKIAAYVSGLGLA